MLTLNFGTVLNGVAQLAGLDRDNLPGHFFKQARDLANRRLSIAYMSAAWPELVRVTNLTTATSDKFVLSSAMSEIIEVYQKDPLATTEAIPQNYRLYDDGSDTDERLLYTRGAQTEIYVEYRVARPELTGDVWVASSDYAIGDQVYSDNNFWDVKVARDGTDAGGSAGTSGDPAPTAADTTNWEKVKIPSRFMGYLIQGIYTDYLGANGTPAPAEEQKAESLLSLEIDSLQREQGQVRKPTVSTY
jgi:hypothetical protein